MDYPVVFVALGILGSTFVWLYNEHQKRVDKIRHEKEKRYEKLITRIRSFGSNSEDDVKANEFIFELQLCWMYCPDIVIQKGNAFLESMKSEKKASDNYQKNVNQYKGEFILELRKDLLLTGKLLNKRKEVTVLKAEDFLDVAYNSNRRDKSFKEEAQ